jgi:hypothetical protein
VVRANLSPGQQATQACHALRQFAEEHPAIDREWHRESNHLALLTVDDEEALTCLLERARRSGIRHVVFREPDIGDALTAIALEPGAGSRRLCRGLRLALS